MRIRSNFLRSLGARAGAVCALLATAFSGAAQGPRPSDFGSSERRIGEPGPTWYATWGTALAEARRSNRPIFLYFAATQCQGVSGVF